MPLACHVKFNRVTNEYIVRARSRQAAWPMPPAAQRGVYLMSASVVWRVEFNWSTPRRWRWLWRRWWWWRRWVWFGWWSRCRFWCCDLPLPRPPAGNAAFPFSVALIHAVSKLPAQATHIHLVDSFLLHLLSRTQKDIHISVLVSAQTILFFIIKTRELHRDGEEVLQVSTLLKSKVHCRVWWALADKRADGKKRRWQALNLPPHFNADQVTGNLEWWFCW